MREAAVPDATKQATISDLSWLNNILGLIKDLQDEMRVEIPRE